jgi:hypothetical protein
VNTNIYLNQTDQFGRSLFKIIKQKDAAHSNCVFWLIQAFTGPVATTPYNCVNGNYYLDWSSIASGNWNNVVNLSWHGAGTSFCKTQRWALFGTALSKYLDSTTKTGSNLWLQAGESVCPDLSM